MSDGISLFPDASGHDRTGDRPDVLDNKKRGCGHLKEGKAYIRGVLSQSGRGILPSFVRCDPPIPYREIGTDGSFTRGYEQIDGLTMQLATDGDLCEYVPLTPSGRYEEVESAWENMLALGLYQTRMDIPESETERHIDRVQFRGPEGAHWGDIPTAGHTDLLMRCGESYYPEPEDFIEECRTRGLSKAIPVGPNRDPPTIVPGITRCWIMHPSAGSDEYGGAIIGYVYLDEVVFTEPEDGEVPTYIREMEDQDKLRTAEIGPEVEADDYDDYADISEWSTDGDEEPAFACDCGEQFDSQEQFAGHKAHCNGDN
jgi:hypothetical protein